MKKITQHRKSKHIGTIEIKKMIDESGVNISASEPDKLMISLQIYKRLTHDIYQMGYLSLDATEELELILDRFFANQAEVELELC